MLASRVVILATGYMVLKALNCIFVGFMDPDNMLDVSGRVVLADTTESAGVRVMGSEPPSLMFSIIQHFPSASLATA